ncbi:MAG: TIGR03915 family putative DNA repair protein [Bacteroidota bacterium]
MMTQFIYDGTYIGLLTSIFDIYERKSENALIVKRDKTVALSLTENIEVYSDHEKAKRVLKGLQRKISHESIANIYRCFLSELKGIENTILDFVRYVFSSEKNVETDFGNSAVIEIAQTARKVGSEKHRFEAFVRFESIGEKFFYAPIDPDYNVLPLIIPHFKRRYADQDWIIFDTKRKYGVHYDQETEQVNEAIIDFKINTTDLTPTGILFDPDEKLYQGLWKNYFKSVNIPIRKNTKLHLQHVPKRYWKYLVEKK